MKFSLNFCDRTANFLFELITLNKFEITAKTITTLNYVAQKGIDLHTTSCDTKYTDIAAVLRFVFFFYSNI